MTELDRIADALHARADTLASSMNHLALRLPSDHSIANQQDVLLRLAVVDLFVEKAQAVLSARARRMMIAGAIASTVAVLALSALGIYIAFPTTETPTDLSTNSLILRVVAAISLGAIVLVAVKYLIALARSFFHEGVTLLSRRHSLRFGRMYIYLNPDKMDLDQMLRAFDWNRGGESSFLDIRPDEIGRTPYSTLAASIGDAVSRVLETHEKRRKSETE